MKELKDKCQEYKDGMLVNRTAYEQLKITSDMRQSQLFEKIKEMETNIEESKSALKEQLESATETLKVKYL